MIDYALKNLWARKTRTILTIVSIIVCTFMITTVDGMLGQMHAALTKDLARYMGKISIQESGADYPPVNSRIYQEQVEDALKRGDIDEVNSTPLLLLVLEPRNNPMDYATVMGVALLPGREKAFLADTKAAAGTTTLEGAGDHAIILGDGAATFYGVTKVGQDLTLRKEIWKVVGILEKTSVTNVDSVVLFPLAPAQKAYGAEGLVSTLLLTAKDVNRVSDLETALAAQYPTLSVASQKTMLNSALKMMDLPNKFMGMISWTIFVVALVLVANIMIIAVRERTREMGVIRAIGGGRGTILSTVLVETLILSLVAGVVGTLAAVPAAYAMEWTWILSQEEIVKVLVLTLAAGTLAGLYPAWRATQVNPLTALRYE